jgi:NTE family protein
MQPPERIGSVLSGGGARGAYEAGAISVLAPALEGRGERPALFVGTSVGAINAAYLAGSRHLDAEQQVDGLLERWRQATKERVIRPILRYQMPLTALRYAGELLSLPRVRLASLLDPAPLERSLRSWMVWGDLRRNIANGVVDALAVTATAAGSGRTVVFVEGAPQPAARHSHVLECADRAGRRAHPGVGGDPDPVSTSAGRDARGGARVVRRRRHPP